MIAGVLNNAEIKIENSNFEIKQEEVKSQYIKSVEGNIINLNTITYGKNIEIKIPVKFPEAEMIDVEEFNKETTLMLSGIYKDNSEKETKIEGKNRIRLLWTEEANVIASQEIEKYFSLNDNQTLLEQKIDVQVEENKFPIENDNLEVIAPEIEGKRANKVVVLANGCKLSDEHYKYDTETGRLEISYYNLPNSENKILLNNGTNEYKIIYTYDKINVETTNVELQTKIKTKLYTFEEEKENTLNETKQIEVKGNIVSTEIESSNEIYKGYLYANSEKETIYNEKIMTEISNANYVDEITIKTDVNNFVNTNKTTSIVSDTYYKNIKFDKQKIFDILGKNGKLTIQNNEGKQLATVTINTLANEQGKIVTEFEEQDLSNIIVQTTKPEREGTLQFELEKGVKATEFDRSTLKSFAELEEGIKVTSKIYMGIENSEVEESSKENIVDEILNSIRNTNTTENTQNETSKNEISNNETSNDNENPDLNEVKVDEEIVKTKIPLRDTKTEANLSLSTKSISTLDESENITLNVNLLSYNQTQDLYKNPTLMIYLPQEIENVNVNSVKVLYAQDDEIKLENYQVKETKGRKVINVVLSGEQKQYVSEMNQGIQIVIDVDVSMNVKTPTTTSKIEMEYTNENGNEKEYNTDTEITLESKYGMFVYNEIESDEKLNDLNSNEIEAEIETDKEEKQIKVNTILVNNYQEPVNNLTIIGNLNSSESNFNVELADKLNIPNAKVYYATENVDERESNAWTEEIEDMSEVKAYKIELEDLNDAENTELSYNLMLPANLEYNQKSLSSLNVVYDYEEQTENAKTDLKLYTRQLEASETQSEEANIQDTVIDNETSKIGKVYVTSMVGDNKLEENSPVYQGQTVKNIVTVENTTGETIKNLVLTVKQDGANFLVKEITQFENTDKGGLIDNITTIEDEDLTENKIAEIPELKAGEKRTYTYEYVVKADTKGITKGELIMTADGTEETIELSENPVKEAKLKLLLNCKYNEIVELTSDSKQSFLLKVQNLTDDILKNITINLKLSDAIKIDSNKFEDLGNGEYKYEINKLYVNENTSITIPFEVQKMEYNTTEAKAKISATATIDGETFTSNTVEKPITNTDIPIKVTQTANIDTQTPVKTEDRLVYTTTIKNESAKSEKFTISDEVPQAAKVQRAYIVKNEKTTEIETIDNNLINTEVDIKAGEEIKFIVETEIDTVNAPKTTITNEVRVQVEAKLYTSNAVTHNLDLSKPKDEEQENYESNAIYGTAWEDEDGSSSKDNNEARLPNIQVYALDIKTAKVAIGTDGEEKKMVTDENGNYYFENLKDGEYIIVFEYDTNQYQATEYQKSEVVESENSDVVDRMYNNRIVAATDVIKINNNYVANIDAGFVKLQKFDLKLDKYISRIIVQNQAGTSVKEYDKTQMAKVELPSQYLKNSTVLLEYVIEVTNEGEVPGYANSIIDYMPKDLSFSSEINKDWYASIDGNLHNASLTNTVIKPGESKQITLILTKTMNDSNIGVTTNMAEIEKDSNTLSIKDSDSKPGNFVQGEDDISTVEVLISLQTGVGITLGVVGIIAILAVVAIIIIYHKKDEEVI